MKDWKQEIAEAIRLRCDHGAAGSGLVGPGCPECQALFVDIMVIMNEALDRLTVEAARAAGQMSPVAMIEEFKRSIPGR